MKLNNWPYVTQAGVAARAFCFGSKTLLLSKEAVMRRKRESPALSNGANDVSSVRTGHRAAPAGGNAALPQALCHLELLWRHSPAFHT